MHRDILAGIYSSVADEIEDTTYLYWQAGPRTWSALHRVVHDLVAHPAAVGIERHLKLDQLQSWKTDQATVVKTLRELAGDSEQLDLLRQETVAKQVITARRELAEIFAPYGDNDRTLAAFARDAAHQIRLLEGENQRLKEALETERRSRREAARVPQEARDA